MTDRLTITIARARAGALNEQLAARGATRRLQIEGRNGYVGLDEITTAGVVVRTISCGTSREICEVMKGMQNALWMIEAPR